MSVKLDPPEYWCPEHDNRKVITAAVEAKVTEQASSFAGIRSSDFEVVVMCPGDPAKKDPGHERTYSGTWSPE